MNLNSLSPKGKRFAEKYGQLVKDMTKAFAQITFEHDTHSFSLLIVAFHKAAQEAKNHLELEEALYEDAPEC